MQYQTEWSEASSEGDDQKFSLLEIFIELKYSHFKNVQMQRNTQKFV